MSCEESVTGLFSHLCDLQLESQRANLIQPKHDKTYWRRRLHKKLYDTLFGYLKGRKRCKKLKPNEGVGSELIGMLTFVYSLLAQRKFDEAARLQHLIEILRSPSDEEMTALFRLLICLSDTAPETEKPMVGYDNFPVLQYKKSESNVFLPNGPPVYGDTQLFTPENSHQYMHYPDHLFVRKSLTSASIPLSVFSLTPGEGLSGNGLFNVKGYLNDSHERYTSSSLFGALVQSEVTSLDAKLNFPEISEMETGSIGMSISKSSSFYSQISEDEGIAKSDVSMSSTLSYLDDLHDTIDNDIWGTALKHKTSQHYTWETIGCEPGPTSKPYFCEAGPCAFDEWFRNQQKVLRILCPNYEPPQRQCISQKKLVEDVKSLLIAISSNTFVLDMETQSFKLLPGMDLYISGMTPDALQNCLQDFIKCGTNCYRLEIFSKMTPMDSFYKAGLVFQAFTEAVRNQLQHYRGTILSIDPDVSLIELRFISRKVFAQMRYLSRLCQCQQPLVDGQQTANGFPVGISLISYLYEETLEECNTENYPMLLAILQTTLRPYTLFVQDWVFHGVYRDTYGEFMIEVSYKDLESRDRRYWSHGYKLKTPDKENSVPSFLRDMARDIFTCGKSVNLLRICCSEHFICQINDQDIPRIMITFSEQTLHQLDDLCQAYIGKIQQSAKQLQISRRQMLERAEGYKQDLMHKAKEVAAEEQKKLQAKLDELKKAEDAKKRKMFLFLKEQMESDLQRRADEKQAEKNEDKVYMQLVTKREEALAAEETELEAKAREEVIQYYEKLSEKAAFREEKALWKVRRSKLHLARMQFLLEEDEQFKKEIKILEESEAKEIEKSLPNWAKNVTTETETIIVPGEEMTKDLPVTAAQVPSSPTPDLFPEADLPKWARTSMVKYGDEDTPSVVSEETETFPLSRTSSEINTLISVPDKESSALLTDQKIDVQDFAESQSTNTHPPNSVELQKIEQYNASVNPLESDIPKGVSDNITQSHQDHVSRQTDQKEEHIHIKKSDVHYASKESDNCVDDKPHIKSVQDKHISQQTESDDLKPLVRINDDRHVSKETSQSDKQSFSGKKMMDVHVAQESQSTEWKVKKKSFFGHVSELSNQDYVISVPRLKRDINMFASKESEYHDIPARSRIKMSVDHSSTKESSKEPDTNIRKTHIKMSQTMSSTKESETVDHEANRLKKFLEQNVHGHSSQSTIQKLLYGGNVDETKQMEKKQDPTEKMNITAPEDPAMVWLDETTVESYMDNFDFLNDAPMADLMFGKLSIIEDSSGYMELVTSDIDAFKYISLPVLLQKSVTMPLVTQISLVNESIINYFTQDLQIEIQFRALRSYLLMADGDFSQNIIDLLMEKLSTRPRPHQLLNPVFLNMTLAKALQYSMHTEDKYTDNLSFAVRYLPKVLNTMEHDTLDCLELRFRTEWPVNVIITEEAMDKYGKVFSFMLQLKRIVWVLKDVWHRLKRDALLHGAGMVPDFRQLHLYRQEMQHFVKVMQAFITNQIILVTWQEFQEALRHDVQNLDDLYRVHMDYLNKAFFRCLLTKNASPVMKIIQEIFGHVLKFHAQLVGADWFRDAKTGMMSHPNFSNMVSLYKAFKKFAAFLFKIVKKLAVRGYQPHLQELLLHLNFNDYYTDN